MSDQQHGGRRPGRPRKAPSQRYRVWHVTTSPEVAQAAERVRRSGETDSELIARLIMEATMNEREQMHVRGLRMHLAQIDEELATATGATREHLLAARAEWVKALEEFVAYLDAKES